MKRSLPLAVCVIGAVIFLTQYFTPHPTVEHVYERLLNYTIVIGVFAIGLGIVSLFLNNWPKVVRQESGWGYSAVTLVGFFVTAGLGLWFGKEEGGPFLWIYNNVLNPITATMFALLAFLIASASYRAFRVRTLLATILLLSAVIVMLGRVPLGDLVSGGWFGTIANWLLSGPNLAAKRAVLIGVGFGQAAVALKLMFGVERSYLGGQS